MLTAPGSCLAANSNAPSVSKLTCETLSNSNVEREFIKFSTNWFTVGAAKTPFEVECNPAFGLERNAACEVERNPADVALAFNFLWRELKLFEISRGVSDKVDVVELALNNLCRAAVSSEVGICRRANGDADDSSGIAVALLLLSTSSETAIFLRLRRRFSCGRFRRR